MASKSASFIHRPLYFTFPTGPPQRAYLLASKGSWLGFGAKVLHQAVQRPWVTRRGGQVPHKKCPLSKCSYIMVIIKHPSMEKSQELIPFQLHA